MRIPWACCRRFLGLCTDGPERTKSKKTQQPLATPVGLGTEGLPEDSQQAQQALNCASPKSWRSFLTSCDQRAQEFVLLAPAGVPESPLALLAWLAVGGGSASFRSNAGLPREKRSDTAILSEFFAKGGLTVVVEASRRDFPGGLWLRSLPISDDLCETQGSRNPGKHSQQRFGCSGGGVTWQGGAAFLLRGYRQTSPLAMHALATGFCEASDPHNLSSGSQVWWQVLPTAERLSQCRRAQACSRHTVTRFP